MDAIVDDIVVLTSVDPLIADVTYLSGDSRKQVLQLLSDDSGKVRDFIDASIFSVTSVTSSTTLIASSSTSSTSLPSPRGAAVHRLPLHVVIVGRY
ncbi:hypothetical protein Tco_1432321, partial [Tanacetum coccineum]